MASKRILKKQIDGMIFDVVDECFSVQLYATSKTEATNKLIDEALDFRDQMLAQVHQANTKKDFPVIHKQLEDKGIYFVEALNGLN